MTTFSFLFFFFALTKAHAATPADAIVANSMVTSIVQLESCTAPQASEVLFRCTGALMPVTKPEINVTGCYFELPLKCATRNLTLEGHTSTYFLNTPSRKTTVKPLDGVITLSLVTPTP